MRFQSTRPLRGATCLVTPSSSAICYFNPRAPCGARRWYQPQAGLYFEFQSTRPLRGATHSLLLSSCFSGDFNPRAPCGARPLAWPSAIGLHYFNPRAPCGARHLLHTGSHPHNPISIHAPLAGRDSKLDEFLSANLRKSNKRDLLSEEKMRHGLPRTTCMSHFRSFFGCEAEAVFCPLALRT